MMIQLMPMAGLGKRFMENHYRIPKPLIPILGHHLFIRAIESFPEADSRIFVCLKEHIAHHHIDQVISQSYPQSHIIGLDGPTEGQACTCLMAKSLLKPDDSIFVASCDYQVIYDEKKYAALLNDPSIDVIIWTFRIGAIKKANPLHFAYCCVENGQVTKVVEKQTISDDPYSDPAVVGSFTFRRADQFLSGIDEMIAENIRVNGEFYVGTSINQLIQKGLRVVTFEVEKFISFGTPEELQHFYYWEEFFSKLDDHPYKTCRAHIR